MTGTLNPSQQRDFRFLLTAAGVSAVGSRITRTAVPMAAVLLLGATPLELGWLSVLGVLPGALVAWWAGAWIDRRSRRAVMIGADGVRALVIASVPLAAVLGKVTLIQLGLVAAFMCVATVLFEIADHAYLPVIIPSEHLVEANSKREAIDALAEITGPSLGGALVQWLTAPFALAVDACSFVVSALLIGRMSAREPQTTQGSGSRRAAGTQLLREAREGVRIVWHHPLLRALFLSTTIYYFFMSFAASLYTLFALQTLHLRPAVLGVVIGCGGLGALAGAAAAPVLARRIGSARLALWALLLGGLAQIFIPLAPANAVTGASFLIASQLLGDSLLTVFAIAQTSLRQRAIAVEVLGRTAAVWKMAVSIVVPIGMMIGALLADYAGIRAAMWALVVGVILAGAPLATGRTLEKPLDSTASREDG
jgi:Na+/melibiose symporter-like transporter